MTTKMVSIYINKVRHSPYALGYILCTKCNKWVDPEKDEDEIFEVKTGSGQIRHTRCGNQFRIRPWSSPCRRKFQEIVGVKRIE